jgi:hypothetical protein
MTDLGTENGVVLTTDEVIGGTENGVVLTTDEVIGGTENGVVLTMDEVIGGTENGVVLTTDEVIGGTEKDVRDLEKKMRQKVNEQPRRPKVMDPGRLEKQRQKAVKRMKRMEFERELERGRVEKRCNFTESDI